MPVTTPVKETVAEPAPVETRTRRVAGFSVLSHGFLIGWAVLTTLPLLWAMVSSLKSDNEILTDPWGLPSSLHWDNFARAWSDAHIGRYFLNSAIVVTGALILTM